jgi:phosphatidylglycerophosphate synthase
MLDRHVVRVCEGPLARAAHAVPPRVSANMLTAAGFGAGIAAAGLIAAGLAPWALVFLSHARVADGLDGAVARLRGPTVPGAVLDTALDPIAYAALAVAFAIAMPESALAAAFLLFGFVSMMTLELSARAVVARDAVLSPPLIGHTETFVVFAVACAHAPAFPALAYVFGAACFIAAGVRVAGVAAQMGRAKP